MILNDVTLSRKGLPGYFKALGGSNVIKVTPSNGSASGSQAIGKRLEEKLLRGMVPPSEKEIPRLLYSEASA